MGIPVIDLFAGPGGLGEGFSSVPNEDGSRAFEIRLSIEKDANAHETLRLRAFFRQFPKAEAPYEYYEIMRQQAWKDRKKLIAELTDIYPKEWAAAEQEAWCYELPFPQEFDRNGKKKGGYTDKEIIDRNFEIDSRIENALKGEKEFLLIGGPPCQAYSLVGRSRNQGMSNDDHRVHLYKEYLRIIARHQPAVFVMENVKGLLSAKVDGEKIFPLIKKDLSKPSSVFQEYECPDYTIYSLTTESMDTVEGQPLYKSDTDYLIRSEEYGVPQRRHRVILLGIREGVGELQAVLRKEPKKVSLESVIGKLPAIRSGLNRTFTHYDPIEKYKNGEPKRKYEILTDSDEKWVKIFSGQIDKLKKWGDVRLNGLSNGPSLFEHGTGAEFVECQNTIDGKHPLKTWFSDSKLYGVANHESRSHLTQDLMRYMYSALFLESNDSFPRLKDYEKYHEDLLPDHKNVKSGKFTDRFRVQVSDIPATTVTSHISKDGHYFIHYDPKQCRSLSVREAARIQTFPDNYLFCGSRTVQFHQVGNAVPPFLAFQIARIVKGVYINNYGEAIF